MSFNRIKIFVLLTFLLTSASIYGIADTSYFKINISNRNPAINEIVRIQVEFELNIEHEAILSIGSNDTLSMRFINNRYWNGSIKKNQRILKEFEVQFTDIKVYDVYIIISMGSKQQSVGTTEKIYVGGAFDESEKVRLLKAILNNFQYRENKDVDIIQLPSTNLGLIPSTDPDELDKFLSSAKEDIIDPELKAKNDSLYNSLIKEYKKLYFDSIKERSQQLNKD